MLIASPLNYQYTITPIILGVQGYGKCTPKLKVC